MRGLVIVLAALLVPAVAHADEISESLAVCKGKSPGDACKGGACVKTKCSRIDYANWDRDASPTPPSRTYDCVECVPGAKATSGCAMSASRVGSWALALTPAVVLAVLERRRRRARRR